MHFTEVKSILSPKNGMNLYRGCTHGCIYCDSRSVCYGMQHEFTDIEVKQNALFLLEKALKSKRKKCMIGTGAMCDPYMHCEEQLQLTRKSLEIIDQYGFGVTLQTKSDLILRDIDILKKINKHSKCVVQMTLTTYDDKLCSILEPNVCVTSRRAEVLKRFRDEGIATVVWLCPILPFINDTAENIEGIIDYCVEAGVYGVINFGMGLTLRDGNREYYYKMLDRHFSGLREKYHKKYGLQYEVISDNYKELTDLFIKKTKENGIENNANKIFAYLREYPENKGYEQLSLF